MSDDFPAFALSEEHEALREAVRALADDKIAPRAAEIDRTSEFPWDVYEALVKADFQAVHIPEAYGGAGADAIATAIVIEEVARACASSSLIPAVNKLGTVPLLLAASEEVKARYLTPVARGEAMFSYALSEPEAGSDAAAMKTKAVPTDSGYVLNGVKRWITNAGVSKYYTVMAVTDPAAGPNGISAFVLEDGDPGFTFGAPEHKLGIKGSPTRTDRATLLSNGDKIEPCGVPVSVSFSVPSSVRMPAFRNAFTSARTRLSPTRARTLSSRAQCEISSKDSPPYYVLR